jgi:hypothetical protein
MEEESKIIYELPNSPEKLLADIMKEFPQDFTTLRKVISLGTVKYSEHPGMTAAVVNTKPYTLIFGKPFMEKNMKSTEDCVFLLSHELTHLVLDHFAGDIVDLFEEKELGKKAVHIIVDCQVNATCYHSLKEDKYMEFIKRFYSQTEMPYCFLRPDGCPPTEELVDLHEKLYSKEGISNEDLVNGLLPWFKEQQESLNDFIDQLLGNHVEENDKSSDQIQQSGDISDLTESYMKDLNKSLEEKIKENQKDKESQAKNYDPVGKNLRKVVIEKVKERIAYNRDLIKEMSKKFVVSPSSVINQELNGLRRKLPTRTPVPNYYDRRAVALSEASIQPVFYKQQELGNKVIIPWYVDVSGSQDHVIPHVMNVASQNRRFIGNTLYCFSTVVSPTSLHEFSKGKYYSTGGTNFNPVIKHIIDNRFKVALILTDGYGCLDVDLIIELKKRGVTVKVGWTVSGPSEEPLQQIAKSTFYMFKGSNV